MNFTQQELLVYLDKNSGYNLKLLSYVGKLHFQLLSVIE